MKAWVNINWLGWLVCVIFWNYGYPSAYWWEDVLVAVVLSLAFKAIEERVKY
tara:strand:- start:4524 stop:4679 length:156 start_codon:yes stop_codon:yes gene_type:complete